MPITAGRFSSHSRRRSRRPLLISRGAVLVLLALLGIAAARPALALDEAPAQANVEAIALKAVDVFPIRFGGVLRLIAGSALLVPATLFSTFSLPFDRNPAVYRDNFELLVREPFDYTFRRPLGQDLGGL
jgi:hypothetical protein